MGFTDLAVTTLRMEETSVLDSTSPTVERTYTSVSANILWDLSSTVLLTTESSRLLDPLSLYSLTTSVLPSVLLLLLSSTVYPTSLPMTLSELERMDQPINLLRLLVV